MTKNCTQHSAIPRCIHTPKFGSLPQRIYVICTRHEAGRTDRQCAYYMPPKVPSWHKNDRLCELNHFLMNSKIKIRFTNAVYRSDMSVSTGNIIPIVVYQQYTVLSYCYFQQNNWSYISGLFSILRPLFLLKN